MTDNLPILEALARTETRLWNALDRALDEEHGISLAWLVVLRVLDASPGSRVQDVADAVDISPGGASKLVDRLVSAGLVDRAADEGDRRVTLLRVTSAGHEVVRRGSATGERWLAERWEPVSRSRAFTGLPALLAAMSTPTHAARATS